MLIRRRKQALEQAFGRGQVSGDGINFALSCPSCNENKSPQKRKLIVRLDDGRYQCWVCGIKGNNVSYLARKHGLNVEIISEVFNSKIKTEVEQKQQLKLPNDFHFLGIRTNDPDVKASLNYLKKRKISVQDIFRWRMLTCRSGRFRRRIIIPSFSEIGELNYFVARTIDGEQRLRYFNSKVPKNDIIFNEIDVDWKKPIHLVEGVFDAIKSPENTVPILGSSLSKSSKLFKTLTRNGCDVTVSLDPDLKQKAFNLAKKLSVAGCNVRLCFAPKETDIGSLNKEQVIKIFSKAKEYNSMAGLQFKISQIKSGSIF